MTDITAITDPDLRPTEAGHAPPDLRPALAAATGTLTATIDGVRPGQLDTATPCEGWTVRELVAHLVGVARRIVAVGEDGDIASIPLVPDVADDDLVGEWHAWAARIGPAWGDDRLAAIVHPPFGDMPGFAALGVYVSELSVHTWDLATATGQQPVYDDTVVLATLDAMSSKLPAAGRPAEIPFADAVPVGPDATPIERLVAFCGRRP